MATIDAELCTAHYVAEQIGGHVLIFAIGAHSNSGCTVVLRREPGEEFPPRFSLWHVRGGSPELQVVTPFSATASFQSMQRVESVAIVDARGAREVPVLGSVGIEFIHSPGG